MLELNKIYCGDCLEIMKEIDNESIDLVLTDPQYNIGKDYEISKDNISDSEFWTFTNKWISQIFRVLKEGSKFYFSCLEKQIFDYKPICEEIGFSYRQLLIWYGPNQVGKGKISKEWSPMFEPIFLFSKGKRTPMLSGIGNTHNVLIESRPQRNFNKDKRYHITQKPLMLYKRIISRTRGNLILDPFIGSGTTAIACKQLGRNFIGIEINPDYVEIANRRLANTYRQLELI